jgi:hypothetical protein
MSTISIRRRASWHYRHSGQLEGHGQSSRQRSLNGSSVCRKRGQGLQGIFLSNKLSSSGLLCYNIKGRNSLSSQMAGLVTSRSVLISKNTSTIERQPLYRSITLMPLHRWRKYAVLLSNTILTMFSTWMKLVSSRSLHLRVHLLQRLGVEERRVRIRLHLFSLSLLQERKSQSSVLLSQRIHDVIRRLIAGSYVLYIGTTRQSG